MVYNPPNVDSVPYLEPILTDLVPQFDHFLMLGDFNTCLIRNDARARRMCDLFESVNLNILPSDPTHHVGESHTLLDLAVTQCVDRVLHRGQMPAPEFSKHDLIYLAYDVRCAKRKAKTITCRSLKNVCKEALVADANSVNWTLIEDMDTLDEKVKALTREIHSLMDVHAPVKTFKVKHPPAPWLTQEIRELFTKRDAAYRKYLRSKNDANWEIYRRLRNRANTKCRDAKNSHIKSSVEAANNPGSLWRTLNKFGIGKNEPQVSPQPHIDVNALNTHFASQVAAVENEGKDELLAHLSSRALPDRPSFNFDLVVSDDIRLFFKEVKTHAKGHDDLGICFLSMIFECILPTVTHIINFSLFTGSFPDSWKLAHIVPIPKVKNPELPNQFRPISILPVLSKLLEKVVHSQVSKYVIEHNLLSPYQSGFRSGHSTSTALLKVTDDVLRNMDRQELTVLVLLDFSNAFLCVDFDILIATLGSMKFEGPVLQWVRSYLTGRKQRVVAGDSASDWLGLNAGVPQGCILSPLFFSLFINNLCGSLRSCSVHLYADDVQLYLSGRPSDIEHTIHLINEDLRRVASWAETRGLTLNALKSQCIILGSRRLLDSLNRLTIPKVKLGGEVIDFTPTVKNLGVVMDEDMSWSHQCSSISRKVFFSLHSLRKLQKSLPQPIKRTLILTLILPLIEYADVIYANITVELSQKLERIQNACIRYICNLRKYDHITVPRTQLSLLKLSSRRKIHSLVLLHRVLHTNTPSYLRSKFSFLSDHGVPTRSQDSLLLSITPHSTNFYDRSFVISTSRLWNQLPQEIRTILSRNSFKNKLIEHFKVE